MEYIEKQICLFVFSRLLEYYNNNFIATDPVYDNTQPSQSFEKSVFKFIFHDSMLDLVPHSAKGIVYDFNYMSSYIVSTITGRYWPLSGYIFINEIDYISTMKSVNFMVEPYESSQRRLFNDLLDNYIGYGLVSEYNGKYVIDMRHLKQFEVKQGYSSLNCIVYLDDDLCFDYCKINRQKRTDDFAIRECMTALITVITIEKHLFSTHFIVSDKFNMLLYDNLDKVNPIYRVILPTSNNPYSINELASVTLLRETGLNLWFNFTRNGLKEYYEYVKRKFCIREYLIPKLVSGKSQVHKHQHLWFDCIHNFVSEFLAIQNEFDCSQFLRILQDNYKEIYDIGISKFENVVDICTMIIYNNIIHECYSNSKIIKLFMNPYTVSTTWKQNGNIELRYKINNMGEQTMANFVAYASSLEAIRLDDERWINMCCVSPEEKKVYQRFRKAISTLDIPENAILHPKNISSSVSY